MSRRVVVLFGVLGASLAFAGCLNDFDEVRMNRTWIGGIDVSAPNVSSGSVTLEINVTVENREGKSGPLVLQVKAHNTATGLLEATQHTAVGKIDRDRTEHVPVSMTLPKRDGYRITALLFQDDQRVTQAAVTVSAIDALSNNVVETGLRVAQLEFLVRNVADHDVSIETQVYLTNEGRDPSAALRLQVKAREVSTGLLADEQWADVSAIPVEATRIRTVNLSVPDAYNYFVEAVLWKGDFIVGSGQGKVQLLPTFTVPKGEEVVVDKPVVSDFIRDDGGSAADADETSGTPGPGAILVVLGLAGLLFLARRRC